MSTNATEALLVSARTSEEAVYGNNLCKPQKTWGAKLPEDTQIDRLKYWLSEYRRLIRYNLSIMSRSYSFPRVLASEVYAWRGEIRRIKVALNNLGIEVANHPNDEDAIPIKARRNDHQNSTDAKMEGSRRSNGETTAVVERELADKRGTSVIDGNHEYLERHRNETVTPIIKPRKNNGVVFGFLGTTVSLIIKELMGWLTDRMMRKISDWTRKTLNPN